MTHPPNVIAIEAALEHFRAPDAVPGDRPALSDAGEVARMGVWEWQAETDSFTESGFWATFLGFPDAQIPTTGRGVAATVHPDDLPCMMEALRACVTNELAEYEVEHRLQHADGSYRWVLSRGKITGRDSAGRALGVRGFYADIARLKTVQDALTASQHFLELVLDNIPAAVFWKDPSGTYLGCNKTFASYAGVDGPDQIIGLTDADLPWRELADTYRVDDLAIMASNQAREKVLWSSPTAEGQAGWLEATKVPLRHPQGQPIGLLAIFHDVTEREHKSQQLKALAKALTLGSGERLLRALTKVAVELSGGCSALVATLVDDGHALVTASYPPELIPERSTYAIAHTPCDVALSESQCIYQGNVQTAFPADQFLRTANIHSYAARRLQDSSGTTIGLLILLHETRFPEPNLLSSLLEIIGANAASELVREKRAQELDEIQRVLSTVLTNIPQGVYWKDRESRYLGCNRHFARLAGFDEPEQLAGRTDAELTWHRLAPRLRAEDLTILSGENAQVISEDRLFDEHGNTLWFEKTKVPFIGQDGQITGILGSIHNITARKKSESEIEQLAFFDPLTRLPNRRRFKDRLESAVAQALRREAAGALLYIDLDHFKKINDTLGHGAGDSLLVEASERIQHLLRKDDLVARLGGDEFVVLLNGLSLDPLKCVEQAHAVARKILSELARPFVVTDDALYITATIGVAAFPEHHDNVDQLIKMADAAMYRGKIDGRNTVFFFDPNLLAAAQERMNIESALRTAVERNELSLHYQPQTDQNGMVIGAEALMRWNHPVLGQVSPARFIPIAEESGLIGDIGLWAIREGLAALQRWNTAEIPTGSHLSINVSQRQLSSHTFVSDVLGELRSALPLRGTLVLELTESAAAENIDDTINKMNQLRSAGVSFSIDDFGVGYSSLGYLARLPLQQLKIDRSFIVDVEVDPTKGAIVATLLTLGKQLNLTVVAEGIETGPQLRALVGRGCSAFQGYFFSRPLTECDFIAFCQTAGGGKRSWPMALACSG